MSSFYFDRLQRDPRFRKQEEAPAPTSDLGAAIEAIIAQQVEERVADQLEKQRPLHNPKIPFHRREFTNRPEQHEFPPPPPQTKPPRDLTVQLQRDELKRVDKVTVGDVVFNVQRNEEGRVVRMVTEGDATPPVPPAPLNSR